MDPFPEKPFIGKLHSISPLVEQSFEWPPMRNFRANVIFNELDPRLRPGMNGRLDIIVERIPDAISVPGQRSVHASRPARRSICRIRTAGVPRKWRLSHAIPTRSRCAGSQAGAKIALVDPTLQAIRTRLPGSEIEEAHRPDDRRRRARAGGMGRRGAVSRGQQRGRGRASLHRRQARRRDVRRLRAGDLQGGNSQMLVAPMVGGRSGASPRCASPANW